VKSWGNEMLTTEEIEKFDDIHPPTADLSINGKMIGIGDICEQLLATMQDNERLREALQHIRKLAGVVLPESAQNAIIDTVDEALTGAGNAAIGG
jgi:hypothetical protein